MPAAFIIQEFGWDAAVRIQEFGWDAAVRIQESRLAQAVTIQESRRAAGFRIQDPRGLGCWLDQHPAPTAAIMAETQPKLLNYEGSCRRYRRQTPEW